MAEVLKPQLYDVSTGKPVDVPEDKIPQLVASGKFGFLKNAQVPVLNPDGDSGTIPADAAHKAFNAGFTYEPADAQLDRIKTDENSGVIKGLEAAGAGAARGATLGLSDQFLTKSGIASPQTLSDLQKYRAGWSNTGEAAGIAIPALFGDEAGVAGAVGKAGKAVTAGAERVGLPLAGRALEAAGLGGSETAAKVLANASEIGSHALGSAVEGAIYNGVGNSVSEQALGDTDLNGEKVMSNFGYGALFGGVLGGAIKGASIAVPEALTAAKNGFTNLKNTLIGTGENDAGLLGRALPDKISDALANRSINLDLDQKMKLVTDTTSDLNQIHNNIETTLKKLNTEIRPQETNALIDTADEQKVRFARQDVVNSMNQAVDLMRKEPELYSQTAARKLEIQRDGIVNGMKHDDTPAQIFQSLKEVKQELQSHVFSKIPTSQEAASINVINDISKGVNKVLKDPDVFGFAGSALAAHDEMLSNYYKYIPPNARKATDFQKAFMAKDGSGPNTKWSFDPKKVEKVLKNQETITGQQKLKLLDGYYDTLKKLPEHLENTYANVPNERFDSEKLSNIIDNSRATNAESHEKYLESINNDKKGVGLGDYFAAHVAMTHPVIGTAMGAYNIVTKPIEHLNKLAEVERLVGKATNAIGRGAAAIFKPAIALADVSRNAITKLSLEDRKEDHKKFSEEIASLQNDPAKLIDKVASNTEAIHGVAPKTSEAIQQASIRATQFLATKSPIPPKTNPFAAEYEPSQAEMSTFDRYRNIVEKPVSALEQVRLGTVTPETIETLNAVYPKLYDHMKQTVMEQATKMLSSGKLIPFNTKQSISMFIGQPIDEALNPQSIMSNQMAFAQSAQENNQPAPGAQKTKPSVVGMRDIDLGNRTSNSLRRNEDV